MRATKDGDPPRGPRPSAPRPTPVVARDGAMPGHPELSSRRVLTTRQPVPTPTTILTAMDIAEGGPFSFEQMGEAFANWPEST
jgi:hypothetical protein